MQSRYSQSAIMRFAFCLVMLLAPVALLHAQATLTTGTPFNIVNENSGKCIGASAQATANGTVLEMYTCANGTYSTQLAQQWIFTAASSGYYEVSDAGATSEAWNVVSNGTSNGSLMQIWSYAGNSNEEFSAVSLGSGYYKFVGQGSGLCLDVPANSTANSVQLDIYTCNGTTAQAFKLVNPSGTGGTCTSAPSAPTGLAASGTTGSSTSLSWTAVTAPANCSISSYTVFENSSEIGTATGTSFAVTGLSASTTYKFTVEASDSVGPSPASSALSVTTSASSGGEGPYSGTPAAIPGTVMAENYDLGGLGVGYEVSSTNGTDNAYRSDGVDLETASAPATGNDLGWTASGQWFRYTVNVSTAGTYTVSFLVAAESAVSDAFHLSNSSGTNLSGSVAVPDTGAWQTWTTVTASVTLPAGTQTLTLDQDNGGWNIDSMAFASGSGGGGSTGKVFAPFEYVGDLGDADQIAPIISASKAKAVILAFLVPSGSGCNLEWPGANGVLPSDTIGSTSMATAIASLQASGVTVAISQGGAGGQEAAAYCSTAAATQAVYQQLITKYNVKWLDFDIEYGETSGQSVRRAQALAALQKANSGLTVSYTLPLGSGGLDSGSGGGTQDIIDAKSAGLNLTIVNGMAMDFGGTNTNQPALSEEGAAALKSQIASAGLTSTVGLTFLPGTSDDNPPNYFTLANATTMVNFANANSYITLLSFWELNRDNGGCPGSTVDEDTCSGVSQSNYEFSSIFEAY
ncbi:MAG: RICIN domain-containing protein [Terracidiphilus sp.]